MPQDHLMQITGIRKSYALAKVLTDVSMSLDRGKIHGLLGENGAGKSTLIKILSGVVRADGGSITLADEPFAPGTARAARLAGLATIFQEVNTIAGLTVRENLSLGAELNHFGILVNSAERDAKFIAILKQLNLEVGLSDKLSTLNTASRKIIEIARALAFDAQVIILDEPTASFSEKETVALHSAIQGARQRGAAILYVSHKLDEVFQLADAVTVLRDGRAVYSAEKKSGFDQSAIVNAISPNLITTEVRAANTGGKTILEIKGAATRSVKDLNVELKAGEIVGFFGLLGAGKTSVARLMFGADPLAAGALIHRGTTLKRWSPAKAVRRGFAFVPEERRAEGILQGQSVSDNIALMSLFKLFPWNITAQSKINDLAKHYREELQIACSSPEQIVDHLSGGNQQKVVIAKCLNLDAEILILDEPTRGVDVGARQEIYRIARKAAAAGAAVAVMSSDLQEIITLCERVVVMRRGQVVREFDDVEANAAAIRDCAHGDQNREMEH